jgi:hypothetical protein
MDRPISGESDILGKPDPVLSPNEGDSDLSDVCLAPHVDPTLAGITSNPDGFASSYSSTESTKGLLDQQELDKDKKTNSDEPVLA